MTKNKLSKQQNLILLFVLIVSVVAVIYFLNSNTANYNSNYYSREVKLDSKIRFLESKEQLIQDCNSNKVYISLMAWQLMNAIEKEALTIYLAKQCANQNKTTDLNIMIIDIVSAKKLASFGNQEFIVY